MLVDRLGEQYSQKEVLSCFDVSRSSYNYHRTASDCVNPERDRLRATVVTLHQASRGSAGSRTIAGQLAELGESVGRYKARSLMREAGLSGHQPKRHRYRLAEDTSVIAPNHLNREFTVQRSNQVWCSDVTYVWIGTGWLYLAVVLDLYLSLIHI